MWGDKTEVMFAQHHWPTWGQQNVDDLLQKQRDMYRYINDETLRLINHGYTMREIAEQVRLPKKLNDLWADRGYYGPVYHTSLLPTCFTWVGSTATPQPSTAFLLSKRASTTSAREIELLRMVREGRSNKIIADRPQISEDTVKGHMRSILSKLNASDRTMR